MPAFAVSADHVIGTEDVALTAGEMEPAQLADDQDENVLNPASAGSGMYYLFLCSAAFFTCARPCR